MHGGQHQTHAKQSELPSNETKGIYYKKKVQPNTVK